MQKKLLLLILALLIGFASVANSSAYLQRQERPSKRGSTTRCSPAPYGADIRQERKASC